MVGDGKPLDSYKDTSLEAMWLLCRYPDTTIIMLYLVLGAICHPPE